MMDSVGAAYEAHESGVVDDAERAQPFERRIFFEEEIRDGAQRDDGVRRLDSIITRFQRQRCGEVPARESPLTATQEGLPPSSEPCSRIQRRTAMQSSRPAGNGHSGASL